MRESKVEVEVRPLRFTAQLVRMREFLSLLGFSTRVSKTEVWATLVGESGQVALHDVATSAAGGRSGETGLWFEVDDLDALGVRFTEAGFGDVTIEDEAWGRMLTVRGDAGAQLGFDDRPTDFYGSEVHEPEPRHGITSVAVVTGAPEGPIDRLLEAAGCTRLPGDDSLRVWKGSGGGLVALSAAGEQSERLAFRTGEPLADLAARLEAAGHAVVARSDTELRVTDPDGQDVSIRPV